MRIFKWDGTNPSIGSDAFIYDLVSNTVCADLLDYLKRDSLFCGLAISIEERFLNFLYLAQDNGLRRVFVRSGRKVTQLHGGTLSRIWPASCRRAICSRKGRTTTMRRSLVAPCWVGQSKMR